LSRDDGEVKVELERRDVLVAEVRLDDATGGLQKVRGYAAVFNRLAEGMPFLEEIAPGAFAKTLADGADVRLLVNHDGLPLARTRSGTLTLAEDAKGLFFEAELDVSDPDTQRVLPKLRRRDLDQMSIGFITISDRWERQESGNKRTLLEVALYDISLVTFPAYPQTSVSLRTAQQVYDSYVAGQQELGNAAEIERERALRAHRERFLQLELRR